MLQYLRLMKADADSIRYCRSLIRGLSLLRLFTSDSPELSGTEIVERMGLHKTTTYRMLAAMCEQGFLVRNEVSGKYSVGAALYILGNLYQYTDNLQKAASPVVELINELTLECTNLGTLSGTAVVYMLREESKHEFRWSRSIGSTMPSHASALGKALLSGLSEREIDQRFPCEELPRLTVNTVATKSELKLELEIVRRTGTSHDPEGCIPLVVGFGSAIRDRSGEIVAALSVSVPVFRLDKGKQQALNDLVLRGAQLISYRLGHRDLSVSIRTLDQLRVWWEQTQATLCEPGALPTKLSDGR